SDTARRRGGAPRTSSESSLADAAVTASTARSKASSFAFDGFVIPLILRTYWSDAFRAACSGVGGGPAPALLSGGGGLLFREGGVFPAHACPVPGPARAAIRYAGPAAPAG